MYSLSVQVTNVFSFILNGKLGDFCRFTFLFLNVAINGLYGVEHFAKIEYVQFLSVTYLTNACIMKSQWNSISEDTFCNGQTICPNPSASFCSSVQL